MLKRSPPRPPKHLKKAGRDLWRTVAREYDVADSAGMALLARAAECVDRIQAAQAAIAKHGEVVLDRYDQPKINPACSLEKDARNGFLAAMRALNLDVEPIRDRIGRPPGGKGAD